MLLLCIDGLFGCFGRKVDGPGLPGGLIIYHGHLFPLKGHPMLLCGGFVLLLVYRGAPVHGVGDGHGPKGVSKSVKIHLRP